MVVIPLRTEFVGAVLAVWNSLAHKHSPCLLRGANPGMATGGVEMSDASTMLAILLVFLILRARISIVHEANRQRIEDLQRQLDEIKQNQL
jgi:hypothetical protein